MGPPGRPTEGSGGEGVCAPRVMACGGDTRRLARSVSAPPAATALPGPDVVVA